MDDHRDLLIAGLRSLSSFFIGETTLGETLTRVSELVRDSTPNVAFVGLTLLATDGRPSTAVFTDPGSPEIDKSQYESGTGPCLDSMRTGTTNVVASTRDDSRWPEFAASCLAHGIGSTLSIALPAREGPPLGAMNLYAYNENSFDQSAIEAATVFAEQAAIVLTNAAEYWQQRTTAENLTEMIKHRWVIEQAKGIIMSTMQCDAERAFELLVQQSQHTNVKLRDVAQQLVEDVVRNEDRPVLGG